MESAIIITLASMAAKFSDPLFLVATPLALILGYRRWWVAAGFVPIAIAAINVVMVWSWWGQLGMDMGDRLRSAAWLLVVWMLWCVIATGIGAMTRRLINRSSASA